MINKKIVKKHRIKNIVFSFVIVVLTLFSSGHIDKDIAFHALEKEPTLNSCQVNVEREKHIVEPNEIKQSETVYITKTGKKIHNKGCKYLKKSCIEVEEKEALKNNYDYCKVCYEN